MSALTHTGILRQKIEQGHTRAARASLCESLLGDIRTALGKVFLETLGIDATVSIVDSRVGPNISTINRLGSTLFGLLALPGGSGLAGFNRDFINLAVNALSGSPDTETAPTIDRPYTRTDAALAGFVVNTFLKEAFTFCPGNGESDDFGMMGFERETAPLAYILADPQYALLVIEMANENRKLGVLELVLPIGCIASMSEPDTPDLQREMWALHMTGVAQHSPLPLRTVVQRLPVPLGAILSLKAGDILELPDASLQNISLEAATRKGMKQIAEGQLGALNANKAFRVSRPLIDEHSEHPIQV